MRTIKTEKWEGNNFGSHAPYPLFPNQMYKYSQAARQCASFPSPYFYA